MAVAILLRMSVLQVRTFYKLAPKHLKLDNSFSNYPPLVSLAVMLLVHFNKTLDTSLSFHLKQQLQTRSIRTLTLIHATQNLVVKSTKLFLFFLFKTFLALLFVVG